MTVLDHPSGPAHSQDGLSRAVRVLLDDTAGLYTSRRWLALENEVARRPPMEVVVDDDLGTAFAAGYHFDATSNPWPAARPDLFLRRVGASGSAVGEVLPSYVIGGRRPGSTLFPAAPAGPGGREALLHELIGRCAAEAAGRGAATVAALYCDDQDTELAGALAAHGGVSFPSWPTNVLQLPGEGFDDWLAALSRKQRGNERADLRKLDASGVVFDVAPLRPQDVDEIVALELGLYGKYGADYQDDEARRLHVAYLDRLDGDAHVVSARLDGRRVGFVSMIRRGDTCWLRQGGFDHEACPDVPVYFGVVFHTVIRWAYDHGVRTLDYATSADTTKRHRGCRSLPRTAWFIPLEDRAERTLRGLAADGPPR